MVGAEGSVWRVDGSFRAWDNYFVLLGLAFYFPLIIFLRFTGRQLAHFGSTTI